VGLNKYDLIKIEIFLLRGFFSMGEEGILMKIIYINKSSGEKLLYDEELNRNIRSSYLCRRRRNSRKNGVKDFAITNILKSLIGVVGKYNQNRVLVIISPGYLSKTKKTAHLLYRYIFDSTCIDYVVGVLDGMGSYKYRKYLINFLQMNRYGSINFSPQGDKGFSRRKTSYDHRKMIFICDPPTCCYKYSFPIFMCKVCSIVYGFKQLEKEDVDVFVESINICGILIGSSNFSFRTYLGDWSGIADKGESDILLYRDSRNCPSTHWFNSILEQCISMYDSGNYEFGNIDREIPDEYQNVREMIADSMGKILLSKLRGGLGRKTEAEFFNDILKDVLKSQIKY
jgi:hypothetical protein